LLVVFRAAHPGDEAQNRGTRQQCPKKPAIVQRFVNQEFIPRWQPSQRNGQTLTDLAMPDALTPHFHGENRPELSVVVPAFNEAAGLASFHRRLVAAMDALGSWEVLYIDDGSDDSTREMVEALRHDDSRIALIALSRNFGKEIATTAGLDHARGDAVIVIDADLQDPPEVIPELVAAWHLGFDMVCARRRERAGETALKKLTAHVFYRLMRNAGDVPLPEDTGDFRLMSRRVVEAVCKLREQHRFMKGLFAWVGFPTTTVLYDRAPRDMGETSWNYWKLWNFALEGITGFTLMPLKIGTYLGLFVALLSVVFGLQVIVKTLLFGNPVAGYPSLMTVILFLGGIQLMTLGVIGEYLGRVFNETKHRPLYLVDRFLPSRVRVRVPE
jgi:glycosyltransferase involved in cell wall biosynthesis